MIPVESRERRGFGRVAASRGGGGRARVRDATRAGTGRADGIGTRGGGFGLARGSRGGPAERERGVPAGGKCLALTAARRAGARGGSPGGWFSRDAPPHRGQSTSTIGVGSTRTLVMVSRVEARDEGGIVAPDARFVARENGTRGNVWARRGEVAGGARWARRRRVGCPASRTRRE